MVYESFMLSYFPAFASPPWRLVRKVATTLVRCFGVSGLQPALHLGTACLSLYTGCKANFRTDVQRVELDIYLKKGSILYEVSRAFDSMYQIN